ncbi:MAG: hypothetical protein GC153_13110 [Alphaproteobacteria bacterium]|nr:hypothetical protein [Alphaproteobacteria bacterium]
MNLPCSRGQRGADGKRCPGIESAPKTRQEVQAWDCLMQAGVEDTAGLLGMMDMRSCKSETVMDLAAAARAEILKIKYKDNADVGEQ